MKAPWANKTGAAKLVAIFSTSLMIALGLCGMNFFAVLRFAPLSGPGDHVPPTAQEKAADLVGNILGATGFVEIMVILISFLGLVFAWLALPSRKAKGGAEKSDTMLSAEDEGF